MKSNFVAVCRCGKMHLHYGTLQQCANVITLRGWEYDKAARKWRCAECAKGERAS